MTALIGALAGINMISGAGMLDFLACQSPEKLVVDAEIIGMVKRMLEGMKIHTGTLALELFEGINFKGDFLRQRATRQLFAQEQYLPSEVIDRGSIRIWQQGGGLDTFARARARANEMLAAYRCPDHSGGQVHDLQQLVEKMAAQAGMDRLPEIPAI
jgi:trimethylamine--corrinoid protein Co-methyltransferase